MTGRPLLLLVSGPLIWVAHFSVLYGAAGFGGALGAEPKHVMAVNWAATLAAAAAIAALLALMNRRPGRDSSRAVQEMAGTLAVLSLWAVAIQALVLWIVPR